MKLSYQDDASQLLIDEIRKLKDDLTNYMQSSSIQFFLGPLTGSGDDVDAQP